MNLEYPSPPANSSGIVANPSHEDNLSKNQCDTTEETSARERSSTIDSLDDDNAGIKFLDWGFRIDRLFEVAHEFYRINESKAFHPTFDERNHMNALILQARYGNVDGARAPDIGALDLVGKNRRHQWFTLRGMSKAEAMSKFICTLDEMCPIFKAYAEAIKISSNLSHSNITDGNQHTAKVVQDSRIQAEADEQLKTIHTSLCRQTYDQFKSYAEKQFPGDVTQQKYLISSLQEQYYQQYISQMNLQPVNSPQSSNKQETERNSNVNDNQQQFSSKSTNINSPTSNPSINNTDPAKSISIATSTKSDYTALEIGDPEPIQTSDANLEPFSSFHTTSATHFLENASPISSNYPSQHEQSLPQTIEDNSPQSTTPFVQPSTELHQEEHDLTNSHQQDQRPVDTWSCGSSSNGQASPLQRSLSEDVLEPASLWTKRGVYEFKDALLDDKHSGSYTVNQGTLVIIQVPTYPDGRYIHFEFASEHYDIGFGLDFIFEQNLIEPLAITIQEDIDDEDEEDEEADREILNEMYLQEVSSSSGLDLESTNPLRRPFTMEDRKAALERRRLDKLNRQARTISIIPTYRRDSHEEIFVVRHKYPGRGYYLFKFDNTYSVLRSKSIFYRICYFI